MMGSHPAPFAFVPLEHGEVGDPDETKIFLWVAGFLEQAMFVGIFLRQGKA